MDTPKDVTFKPLEEMACAEVSIIDDSNEELPENFQVGFGDFPPDTPGLTTGMITISTVTIIDDDEPRKQGFVKFYIGRGNEKVMCAIQ